MQRINILENIDVINYAVIEAFNNINLTTIEVKNEIYKSDFFSVDTKKIRRAELIFQVRTKFLQNLCTISMSRNKLTIKYNNKFYFELQEKRKKYLLTSSITGSKNLELNTLESDFNAVFSNPFETRIDIDYAVLEEMLALIITQYSQYIETVEEN